MAKKPKVAEEVKPDADIETQETPASNGYSGKRYTYLSDDEIIENALAYFDRIDAYEADQRKEELDDLRFSGLLEQWPLVIRQIREGDPSGSRPCLTVDKVNQYKNQIINNIRQSRPSIKVNPVDDNGDIEVAEVYEGLVRHIEDASRADIAYDWAAEGQVTTGVGYFRVNTERPDDSFEQEIKIVRIRNRFSVYYDDTALEPDGSDQQESLVTELVNKNDFKKQFPKANPASFKSSTGDNAAWNTQSDIRLAEYFWIEKQEAKLYLLEDGNSVFDSEYDSKTQAKIIHERTGYKTIVCWAKITMYDVLEHTRIPGKFIPIVPVFGIENDVDGKRHLRGIVRGVKDAQRMYNYNRSMMAENLNLTVKAPFIGAVGQFESKGAEWASANRVNYAYLEYDPISNEGSLAPPPQRQGFAGIPSGLLQDIETSEHDIQAALGMYQASVGQDGNAKSGIAMNAQQKQGDMATFHFPDNIGRSIRQCGRIIIGQIPEVYDARQVVRILGEDGTASYANISTDSTQNPEAVNKKPSANGAVTKIYNLGVGKYDVTITVGQSYATKRLEGAQFLSGIAQSNPDLMPIIGDLLFKSLDMPYSEEIADRLKLMAPPQIQQAENNGDDSPEVQQVKQQASQQIQHLSQGIHDATVGLQNAHAQIAQLQAQAKNDADKNNLEAQRVQIMAYEAETERMQVELQANADGITPERISAIEQAVDLMLQHLEQNVPTIQAVPPQEQPQQQVPDAPPEQTAPDLPAPMATPTPSPNLNIPPQGT